VEQPVSCEKTNGDEDDHAVNVIVKTLDFCLAVTVLCVDNCICDLINSTMWILSDIFK